MKCPSSAIAFLETGRIRHLNSHIGKGGGREIFDLEHFGGGSLKRISFAGLFVFFGFVTFVTSPLVTAWFIRDAVKNGNAQFLEKQVDWAPVKATLKSSMSQLMVDSRKSHRAGLGGLWDRVKFYFKKKAVSSAIDYYGNARGLPKLFQMARTSRTNLLRLRDPDDEASLRQRIYNFWSRVKRAEFKSLTRFELDMLDKYDAKRFYCGVLELRGFRWILTELHVRRAGVKGF